MNSKKYICEGRELPKELKDMDIKKSRIMQEKLEYASLEKEKFQIKPIILAFDTETYAASGDLMTLCLSTGEHVEFKPKEINLDKIFELFRPYLRKNVIFFAWNLGFDASVLLKFMGKEIIDFKEAEYKFRFKKYNVFYIPKKSLSISDKNHHSIIMYDIASLFGKKKLDDMANKFLGEQKEYNGKYKNKNFPNNILDDKIEKDKVIEYCVKDAQLTQKLSEFWIDNFYTAFGIYPKKYHSAGTIAINYLKTQMKSWCSFFKIPFEIQELAFLSFFGGRFEVMQRGKFFYIFHYDINSAYPYAMVLMPDFNNGNWYKIKSIKDLDKIKLGYVGFYKIDVTVNEKIISPFLYRPINKLNIYAPRGRFITYCTSDELRVALEHYDVKLHSLKGHYFIPNLNQDKTFSKIIKEMYRQRLKQKDEGQKSIYRIIINSLYGKTAQIKPVPTNFFSPVVCSYITGKCRSMLLEAVKDNKNDVVAFATDAVFSKKPLKVNVEKTKVLGAWSFEFHKKLTIFMSGVYTFSEFNSKSRKWINKTRSRGFKIRCIRENGTEYKLDLEKEMLHVDKDGKIFIKIKYMLPNTIAASIASHNIENIAKFDIKEKEINLNGDKKRLWLDKLVNLKSQHKSLTLPVDII